VPDDDAAGRQRSRASDPDEGTTDRTDTAAGEPAETADEDGGKPASGRKARKADEPERRAPLWIETVVLLGVALVMALVIKTFFVQAFYIPSESMEPGLVTNDRILVQKPSYWFGEPGRGDVVVFEDPGGWLTGPVTGPQTWLAKGLAKIGLYPTGGHLVKRVIGVAGDTVTCCDDQGRILVNGKAIDEDDFIRPQPDPPAGCDGPMGNGGTCQWEVTVPDDRLFVMGDNRAASADSSARLCRPRAKRCDTDRAFVPVELVVGKVFALVWPLGHAEFIGTPDAFDEVPDP
jgi:signal peptidase I